MPITSASLLQKIQPKALADAFVAFIDKNPEVRLGAQRLIGDADVVVKHLGNLPTIKIGDEKSETINANHLTDEANKDKIIAAIRNWLTYLSKVSTYVEPHPLFSIGSNRFLTIENITDAIYQQALFAQLRQNYEGQKAPAANTSMQIVKTLKNKLLNANNFRAWANETNPEGATSGAPDIGQRTGLITLPKQLAKVLQTLAAIDTAHPKASNAKPTQQQKQNKKARAGLEQIKKLLIEIKLSPEYGYLRTLKADASLASIFGAGQTHADTTYAQIFVALDRILFHNQNPNIIAEITIDLARLLKLSERGNRAADASDLHAEDADNESQPIGPRMQRNDHKDSDTDDEKDHDEGDVAVLDLDDDAAPKPAAAPKKGSNVQLLMRNFMATAAGPLPIRPPPNKVKAAPTGGDGGSTTSDSAASSNSNAAAAPNSAAPKGGGGGTPPQDNSGGGNNSGGGGDKNPPPPKPAAPVDAKEQIERERNAALDDLKASLVLDKARILSEITAGLQKFTKPEQMIGVTAATKYLDNAIEQIMNEATLELTHSSGSLMALQAAIHAEHFQVRKAALRNKAIVHGTHETSTTAILEAAIPQLMKVVAQSIVDNKALQLVAAQLDGYRSLATMHAVKFDFTAAIGALRDVSERLDAQQRAIIEITQRLVTLKTVVAEIKPSDDNPTSKLARAREAIQTLDLRAVTDPLQKQFFTTEMQAVAALIAAKEKELQAAAHAAQEKIISSITSSLQELSRVVDTLTKAPATPNTPQQILTLKATAHEVAQQIAHVVDKTQQSAFRQQLVKINFDLAAVESRPAFNREALISDAKAHLQSQIQSALRAMPLQAVNSEINKPPLNLIPDGEPKTTIVRSATDAASQKSEEIILTASTEVARILSQSKGSDDESATRALIAAAERSVQDTILTAQVLVTKAFTDTATTAIESANQQRTQALAKLRDALTLQLQTKVADLKRDALAIANPPAPIAKAVEAVIEKSADHLATLQTRAIADFIERNANVTLTSESTFQTNYARLNDQINGLKNQSMLNAAAIPIQEFEAKEKQRLLNEFKAELTKLADSTLDAITREVTLRFHGKDIDKRHNGIHQVPIGGSQRSLQHEISDLVTAAEQAIRTSTSQAAVGLIDLERQKYRGIADTTTRSAHEEVNVLLDGAANRDIKAFAKAFDGPRAAFINKKDPVLNSDIADAKRLQVDATTALGHIIGLVEIRTGKAWGTIPPNLTPAAPGSLDETIQLIRLEIANLEQINAKIVKSSITKPPPADPMAAAPLHPAAAAVDDDKKEEDDQMLNRQTVKDAIDTIANPGNLANLVNAAPPALPALLGAAAQKTGLATAIRTVLNGDAAYAVFNALAGHMDDNQRYSEDDAIALRDYAKGRQLALTLKANITLEDALAKLPILRDDADGNAVRNYINALRLVNGVVDATAGGADVTLATLPNEQTNALRDHIIARRTDLMKAVITNDANLAHFPVLRDDANHAAVVAYINALRAQNAAISEADVNINTLPASQTNALRDHIIARRTDLMKAVITNDANLAHFPVLRDDANHAAVVAYINALRASGAAINADVDANTLPATQTNALRDHIIARRTDLMKAVITNDANLAHFPVLRDDANHAAVVAYINALRAQNAAISEADVNINTLPASQTNALRDHIIARRTDLLKLAITNHANLAHFPVLRDDANPAAVVAYINALRASGAAINADVDANTLPATQTNALRDHIIARRTDLMKAVITNDANLAHFPVLRDDANHAAVVAYINALRASGAAINADVDANTLPATQTNALRDHIIARRTDLMKAVITNDANLAHFPVLRDDANHAAVVAYINALRAQNAAISEADVNINTLPASQTNALRDHIIARRTDLLKLAITNHANLAHFPVLRDDANPAAVVAYINALRASGAAINADVDANTLPATQTNALRDHIIARRTDLMKAVITNDANLAHFPVLRDDANHAAVVAYINALRASGAAINADVDANTLPATQTNALRDHIIARRTDLMKAVITNDANLAHFPVLRDDANHAAVVAYINALRAQNAAISEADVNINTLPASQTNALRDHIIARRTDLLKLAITNHANLAHFPVLRDDANHAAVVAYINALRASGAAINADVDANTLPATQTNALRDHIIARRTDLMKAVITNDANLAHFPVLRDDANHAAVVAYINALRASGAAINADVDANTLPATQTNALRDHIIARRTDLMKAVITNDANLAHFPVLRDDANHAAVVAYINALRASGAAINADVDANTLPATQTNALRDHIIEQRNYLALLDRITKTTDTNNLPNISKTDGDALVRTTLNNKPVDIKPGDPNPEKRLSLLRAHNLRDAIQEKRADLEKAKVLKLTGDKQLNHTLHGMLTGAAVIANDVTDAKYITDLETTAKSLALNDAQQLVNNGQPVLKRIQEAQNFLAEQKAQKAKALAAIGAMNDTDLLGNGKPAARTAALTNPAYPDDDAYSNIEKSLAAAAKFLLDKGVQPDPNAVAVREKHVTAALGDDTKGLKGDFKTLLAKFKELSERSPSTTEYATVFTDHDALLVLIKALATKIQVISNNPLYKGIKDDEVSNLLDKVNDLQNHTERQQYATQYAHFPYSNFEDFLFRTTGFTQEQLEKGGTKNPAGAISLAVGASAAATAIPDGPFKLSKNDILGFRRTYDLLKFNFENMTHAAANTREYSAKRAPSATTTRLEDLTAACTRSQAISSDAATKDAKSAALHNASATTIGMHQAVHKAIAAVYSDIVVKNLTDLKANTNVPSRQNLISNRTSSKIYTWTIKLKPGNTLQERLKGLVSPAALVALPAGGKGELSVDGAPSLGSSAQRFIHAVGMDSTTATVISRNPPTTDGTLPDDACVSVLNSSKSFESVRLNSATNVLAKALAVAATTMTGGTIKPAGDPTDFFLRVIQGLQSRQQLITGDNLYKELLRQHTIDKNAGTNTFELDVTFWNRYCDKLVERMEGGFMQAIDGTRIPNNDCFEMAIARANSLMQNSRGGLVHINPPIQNQYEIQATMIYLQSINVPFIDDSGYGIKISDAEVEAFKKISTTYKAPDLNSGRRGDEVRVLRDRTTGTLGTTQEITDPGSGDKKKTHKAKDILIEGRPLAVPKDPDLHANIVGSLEKGIAHKYRPK